MSVALGAAPTRTAPPAPPRFRLRRRAHKVALVAHVLSSVGWFGIAVMVAFAGIAAAVTDDATLANSLYRTVETAPWLSIPIGLLAIATGVVHPPLANLAAILVGLPLVAMIGGWLLAGRVPPATARRPLE